MTDHIVDNIYTPFVYTRQHEDSRLGMHMQDNTPLVRVRNHLLHVTTTHFVYATTHFVYATTCFVYRTTCFVYATTCFMYARYHSTHFVYRRQQSTHPQALYTTFIFQARWRQYRLRTWRHDTWGLISGNSSLHYFHSFAVKDRIDFSHLSTHSASLMLQLSEQGGIRDSSIGQDDATLYERERCAEGALYIAREC